MSLSREICKMCFHANPIGFTVPEEIWRDVVPERHHDDVVCIACFARLADEKLVPWDHQIKLYPVSLHRVLSRAKDESVEMTGSAG